MLSYLITSTHLFMWFEFVLSAGHIRPPFKVMHTLWNGDKLRRALCSKQKKDVIKNVLKLPSKSIKIKVIGYIIENYFMQHQTTQLPVFLWLHTCHMTSSYCLECEPF